MAEGKRREERRRNMQRGQGYGMNSIFHRISVRKYQNRDVEQEKIELMLKAAMAAPSACNQQPWEFYVVKDKAVIGRLSEASPYAKCAKDAPVVFVPCFRSKGIAPEYFNIDMSAAVENLLLEVRDPVREEKSLPSRRKPRTAIRAGADWKCWIFPRIFMHLRWFPAVTRQRRERRKTGMRRAECTIL